MIHTNFELSAMKVHGADDDHALEGQEVRFLYYYMVHRKNNMTKYML